MGLDSRRLGLLAGMRDPSLQGKATSAKAQPANAICDTQPIAEFAAGRLMLPQFGLAPCGGKWKQPYKWVGIPFALCAGVQMVSSCSSVERMGPAVA